jgi:hypothetical protein
MLNATVGQLFVNEALPEDLRDYDRVLDKKELHHVLREIAQRHPDRYREISFALSNLGRKGAQESGSFSFGVRHLKRSKAAQVIQTRIRAKMDRILSRDDITDKERNELIIRAVGKEMKPQQEAILAEAIADKNPLALQVLSGTRGSKMNLSSLLGGDLLYSDQRDNPLPIPVLRSYSEGLSPAEYWAGSYGARKGIMATKFATQDAGFLSKQLNQIAHRLVVTDKDYTDEGRRGIQRGLPIDTSDADSEGSLLAIDTGPYEKNTVITPKVRKHLRRLGKERILIRSPVVGGSPSGGVYARDVGIRETGRLPGRGEQVGLQAVQALSEPLSQGQLSAKHSGGVTGEEKAVSGFQYINQLVQVPKTFKGGAAHTTEDGTVQRIEEAPAGGYYVTVNDKPHYVAEDYDILVKKGDKVEAGDVISEGFPNPSIVTQYKGVGDGRKYFVKAFKDAMGEAGIRAHRRNIELLSRGLINHVRLTEEHGDNVPDDIVPYSTLEHKWEPRTGYKNVKPKQAVGKYLEQPVLHYTIGTKVRPSMLKELKSFGIDEITVHEQPPPFEPEMIRGMYSLQHDPDWMTRFYGSGLKKSLLSGVHRGAVSEELGTSFVPSIARSVDFGRTPGSIVKSPARAYPMEEDTGEVKVAVESYTSGSANIGGYGEHDEEGNNLTFPGFSRTPALYNQPSFSETSNTPFPGQNSALSGFDSLRSQLPGGSNAILPTSHVASPTSAITPPSNQGTVPQSAIPSHGPDLRGTGPTTGPVGLQGRQRTTGDSHLINKVPSSTGLPAYDPSKRVRGYQSGGRQSQQPLPGLLGSPFGSQMMQHAKAYGGGMGGALALGAMLSPGDARTAMSSTTTDARLGGLSNAFYDAHQGAQGGERSLDSYDRDNGFWEWDHEEDAYQEAVKRRNANPTSNQWQNAGRASGAQQGSYPRASGTTKPYDPESVTSSSAAGSPVAGSPVAGSPVAGSTVPAPTGESSTAGQGNVVDPTSNNAIARYGVAAGVNTALNRGGTEAGKAAIKGSLGKRVLTEAGKLIAPRIIPAAVGGTAAGTAVAGTGALAAAGAAVPLLPALGGFAAINAITELGDAAGILPQWAGGTGMGNFGWDHKQFEQGLQDSGTLGQAGSAIMNPLKGVHTILSGSGELIGGAAGAVRDWATGSDAVGREQPQREAEAKQQQQQAQQAVTEAEATGDPQQIAGAQDQFRKMQQANRDIGDQTADWSYNKKFRGQVETLMNDKGWGGREGAQGVAQREALQGVLKDYDDNVSWYGSGDMGKQTRRRISGLENAVQLFSQYNHGRGPDPETQPDKFNHLLRAKAKLRVLHMLNNQQTGKNRSMPGHLRQNQ